MAIQAPLITSPSENEVLAKIEMIGDQVTRNALLAIFFWRLGTRGATEPTPPIIQVKVTQEE